MEAWISLDVAVAMVTKQTSPAEVNQTPKYHLSFARRGDAMCTVIFPGCFHNKHSKCNCSDVTANTVYLECRIWEKLQRAEVVPWKTEYSNQAFLLHRESLKSGSDPTCLLEQEVIQRGAAHRCQKPRALLTHVPLYAEIQQRSYFLHFLSTYRRTSTQ